MKNTGIVFFFVLTATYLFGQNTWTLDPGHSRVGFTVTHHMISEVDGYFREFEAKMTTSEEDYSDAVFEFTAQTASLNTENERRDGHLKSDDIFDVVKYPTISFKSTSLTQIAGERYKISGDLTIKDKTLPITLDLWMVGPKVNERAKRYEIGVKALGTLNRKAFGVGERLGTASVSEEVSLRITGELNKAM
jgi:polyisoprenoid-binding protein YceI